MLKAIFIALCIYSGIEAEYERSAIAAPNKSTINRFERGAVTNPVPLVQTTPAYPKDALHKKLMGKVWLKGIVRKDGSVEVAQVVRYPKGGESLVKAAMREVSQNWKFKPGLLNGEPVDVLTTIEIQFNLE